MSASVQDRHTTAGPLVGEPREPCTTPVVPHEFRAFQHGAYVNAYARPEISASCRFFGTENMPGFGSWPQARILFLAQDCGVVDALNERIAANHAEPHGYGETVRTNLEFRRLVEESRIPLPQLYGSALGSLWRRSGGKSGRPPAWSELKHRYAARMLRWAVSQLPRLRVVACLGVYAWEATMLAADESNSNVEFRRLRDAQGSRDLRIGATPVRVFPMFHPGARGTDSVVRANWAQLGEFTGRQ
jgi:hypothetical protein